MWSRISPSLNNDLGSCIGSYLKYSIKLFVCSAIEINHKNSRSGSKCTSLSLPLTLSCSGTKVIRQFDLLNEISLNTLLSSFVYIFAPIISSLSQLTYLFLWWTYRPYSLVGYVTTSYARDLQFNPSMVTGICDLNKSWAWHLHSMNLTLIENILG